jgi:hypothetical protein
MNGAGWEEQDKTVTQMKPGSDPGFQAQLPTAKKYAFLTRLSNSVFLASSAQKKVDAMNLVRQEALTNAGQLLTKHDVEHPGSADHCLHQDHASVVAYHLPDDHGMAAKLMPLHLSKHSLRHLWSDNGD